MKEVGPRSVVSQPMLLFRRGKKRKKKGNHEGVSYLQCLAFADEQRGVSHLPLIFLFFLTTRGWCVCVCVCVSVVDVFPTYFYFVYYSQPCQYPASPPLYGEAFALLDFYL